jgi:hypothetical protein
VVVLSVSADVSKRKYLRLIWETDNSLKVRRGASGWRGGSDIIVRCHEFSNHVLACLEASPAELQQRLSENVNARMLVRSTRIVQRNLDCAGHDSGGVWSVLNDRAYADTLN